MIKIGVTGSIASGKSTFAKFLSQSIQYLTLIGRWQVFTRQIFSKKIFKSFNLENKRILKSN